MLLRCCCCVDAVAIVVNAAINGNINGNVSGIAPCCLQTLLSWHIAPDEGAMVLFGGERHPCIGGWTNHHQIHASWKLASVVSSRVKAKEKEAEGKKRKSWLKRHSDMDKASLHSPLLAIGGCWGESVHAMTIGRRRFTFAFGKGESKSKSSISSVTMSRQRAEWQWPMSTWSVFTGSTARWWRSDRKKDSDDNSARTFGESEGGIGISSHDKLCVCLTVSLIAAVFTSDLWRIGSQFAPLQRWFNLIELSSKREESNALLQPSMTSMVIAIIFFAMNKCNSSQVISCDCNCSHWAVYAQCIHFTNHWAQPRETNAFLAFYKWLTDETRHNRDDKCDQWNNSNNNNNCDNNQPAGTTATSTWTLMVSLKLIKLTAFANGRVGRKKITLSRDHFEDSETWH